MDDNQKPFACTMQGCQMTFTNEDHLNWHHKKHDMVLNLGLANKNVEVADQTPTPTRFIRNCEEVGLFQDLQNVNPFDETFKKAIESTKNGLLHVPEASSNDDTLHTPHIFPHVENTVKYVRNDSEFSIDNVPSINEENDEPDTYNLTIDTGGTIGEKTKHNDLKHKLKETIKNKVKNPVIATPITLEKTDLSVSEVSAKRPQSDKDSNSKAEKSGCDGKAKIREMNREAQLRCRKRKKMQWKKMEEELKLLKSENSKLVCENQTFKQKFYAMKELLVRHKRNPLEENISVLGEIEAILNTSVAVTKKRVSTEEPLPIVAKRRICKKEESKTSVAILHNPGQSDVQKPVVIQVMGSVSQLAVSLLPNK